MKKYDKFFNEASRLARWRDIGYIAFQQAALWLLDSVLRFYYGAKLSNLLGFVAFLLSTGLLLLVYAARWYKLKTGESLYGQLFSPDREGSLIQILSRARKTYADIDRNKSKGLNTKLGGDGILLGLNEDNKPVMSPSNAEEHVLVVGGSGTGKTRCVVENALDKFEGSAFAIDISGDITKAFKDENFLVFDPYGKRTVCFNVLALVDNEPNPSKKIVLLKRLANLVIPEYDPKKSEGSAAYFQQGAHLLFYGALVHYYAKGLDFCELCYKITSLTASELLKEINMDGKPNAKLAVAELSRIRDYNLSSMKQTVNACINVFATSRSVKRVLKRENMGYPSVSPATLEQDSIILRVPQNEVDFFAPMMRLVSGLVLDYCSTRELYPENKILICLDEFSSLGFIDIIKPLETLRKYGARVIILTQSLADLDNIYGENKRRILLDNCGIKMILSAGDRDTQEYFSRLIGTHEVVKKTRTYDGDGAKHTYTTVEKPIYYPEALSHLGEYCIVILPDGYMQLRKHYYLQKIS